MASCHFCVRRYGVTAWLGNEATAAAGEFAVSSCFQHLWEEPRTRDAGLRNFIT